VAFTQHESRPMRIVIGQSKRFGEIEMTDTSSPADVTQAQLMAKYGITRVPTDRFHYKFYRYTNLEDALAQAKRDVGPS
jgi:hypothetical protein